MHEKKKLILLFPALFLFSAITGVIGGSLAFWYHERTDTGGKITKEVNGETRIVVTEGDAQTIEVVKRANSAVVSITILKELEAASDDSFFFNDFFEFGFPFEMPPVPVPRPSLPGGQNQNNAKPELFQVGGGSGFIVRRDGLIVTNRHVVADEDAVYRITLAGGEIYNARVLAKDPLLDVALIKIDATDLPVLPLGDSDELVLGQTVIVIGNVLAEFGNTVTRGIISGIGRRVVAGNGFGIAEVLEEAIQTDAAINPGNSGGPLLNLAGEVVGISTAVSQRGQLVGFAIPINAAKRTIESVLTHGRIIRPWLGVRYIPITPRLSEEQDLPVTHGALIVSGETPEDTAVVPGSPADKAGLQEHDILLEINGKKLDERDSLAREIATYSVGDTITLRVLRDGEEKDIEVTLAEFPSL